MKFTDDLVGNVVVFKLSGRMLGGEDTTRFHGRIHEYLNLNKSNVLVDLGKVDWTNSQGLGMLISALASVKKAGGRMVLANIDRIENLLAITRLITIFEHFDSYDEALKALQP